MNAPMLFISLLLLSVATAFHKELQAKINRIVDHTLEDTSKLILTHRQLINTSDALFLHERTHPSRYFEHLSWDELLKDNALHHFLVHISPSSLLARRKIISIIGHSLESYVPHNSYIVSTTVSKAHQIQSLRGVNWVGYLEPLHKSTLHHAEHAKEVLDNPYNHSHAGLMVSISPMLSESDIRIFLEDAVDFLNCHVGELHSDRVELWFDLEEFGNHHVEADIEWLVHRSEVLFVEPRAQHNTLNKWARGVVEAGVNLADYDSRRGLLSWDFDLNGENQVIGVGDTGIDLNSCFFADLESSATPFVSYSSTVPSNGNAKSFLRKVIQYVTFADDLDESGHGTHVSGSVAGKTRVENSPHRQFDGIASNAKIAFFDIGKSTNGAVTAPGNLGTQFFAWAYAAGARIHTNSWGSRADYYTSASKDVDEYMWNNKDFVAVFAAGNFGGEGVSTIVSPASSKNGIAVGASINSPYMFYETFCEGGLEPQRSYCDLVRPSKIDYFNIEGIALFSSMGPTFDGRTKPDLVAPGMFVYSAQNNRPGTQTCFESASATLDAQLGTSMSAPIVAGALALVRQYFVEGFYPTGRRNAENGFSPSGALLKAMAISGSVDMDGFMDISDGKGRLSGEYRGVGDAPNNIQGFGRLQLDRVLKFANRSNFNAFVTGWDSSSKTFEDEQLQATSDFRKYRICVIGEEDPFPRVTLVWMDAPASQMASVALVNDLDLLVENADSGEKYYGNGAPDRVNNVEQVVMSFARINQTYDITVYARNIAVGPQPYSLVVTGKVGLADSEGVCNFDFPFVDSDFVVIDKGETPPPLDDKSDGLDLLSEPWFVILLGVFVVLLTIVVVIPMMKRVCTRGRSRVASDVAPADPPGKPLSFPLSHGWKVEFQENSPEPIYIHSSGVVSDTLPVDS